MRSRIKRHDDREKNGKKKEDVSKRFFQRGARSRRLPLLILTELAEALS